jgi:colanic acid biosynthesis glycosyl transferase WcaI
VRVMKSSQVGLVFQDSGAGNIIFPSKLAGILAAGQAVLLVAEADSDIARLVGEHDCGWVVSPGDVAAFEAAIRETLDPVTLLAKRHNAYRLGHALFGKQAVAGRWIELFEHLQNAASKPAG